MRRAPRPDGRGEAVVAAGAAVDGARRRGVAARSVCASGSAAVQSVEACMVLVDGRRVGPAEAIKPTASPTPSTRSSNAWRTQQPLPDNEGQTPLMLVAKQSAAAKVDGVSNYAGGGPGADRRGAHRPRPARVDREDGKGYTPLQTTPPSSPPSDLVELLLNNGAADPNKLDGNGQSALHWAVRSSQYDARAPPTSRCSSRTTATATCARRPSPTSRRARRRSSSRSGRRMGRRRARSSPPSTRCRARRRAPATAADVPRARRRSGGEEGGEAAEQAAAEKEQRRRDAAEAKAAAAAAARARRRARASSRRRRGGAEEAEARGASARRDEAAREAAGCALCGDGDLHRRQPDRVLRHRRVRRRRPPPLLRDRQGGARRRLAGRSGTATRARSTRRRHGAKDDLRALRLRRAAGGRRPLHRRGRWRAASCRRDNGSALKAPVHFLCATATKEVEIDEGRRGAFCAAGRRGYRPSTSGGEGGVHRLLQGGRGERRRAVRREERPRRPRRVRARAAGGTLVRRGSASPSWISASPSSSTRRRASTRSRRPRCSASATPSAEAASTPNKARFVQELTASKAGRFRTLAQLAAAAAGGTSLLHELAAALRRPLPPLEHQRPCERSCRFAASTTALAIVLDRLLRRPPRRRAPPRRRCCRRRPPRRRPPRRRRRRARRHRRRGSRRNCRATMWTTPTRRRRC